jgi:hypothetical protein
MALRLPTALRTCYPPYATRVAAGARMFLSIEPAVTTHARALRSGARDRLLRITDRAPFRLTHGPAMFL